MYYILRIISFALCAVPRRTLLFFGKQFGLFVYHLFPIRKKVALKNISIAFKSEPSSYHENILKKTYAHYGMVLMDFLRTPYINNKHLNQIAKLDLKFIRLKCFSNFKLEIKNKYLNKKYIKFLIEKK